MVLGHFCCRVCEIRTRCQSSLFYWRWWLFERQGHWSARLHHVCDVLDLRVPQEHDPCYHLRSLRLVVLLFQQPSQEHHPRSRPPLFDLQFWKYQSWKLSRCNHQHAQTSMQYCATARSKFWKHRCRHCALCSPVSHRNFGLGCSVHQCKWKKYPRCNIPKVLDSSRNNRDTPSVISRYTARATSPPPRPLGRKQLIYASIRTRGSADLNN